MSLKVSDEEMARRKENWTPKKVETFPNSYLKRYAHLVTSASTGAVSYTHLHPRENPYYFWYPEDFEDKNGGAN